MLKDYRKGIRTNFDYAKAVEQSGRLSLKTFFKYANEQKIKFK